MNGWRCAYVGLGSNLAEPAQQVLTAFDELAALTDSRLDTRSALFRSAPMGPPEQPAYINAAARLLTALEPAALLEGLQAIERAHGRDRSGPRWGPRTLDLDLLLYENLSLATATLILPHPGLTARNFVVYPLAQIAPGLVLPGGEPLADLRARLGHEGLEQLEGT